MIISALPEPNKEAFNSLLNTTVQALNATVHSERTITNLAGSKMEPYIKDLMSELAVGTVFEDSIELIAGQKFPDIIANKYYGVEVKTTIQNHWRTTGNSVLENTRVEDVERIFMLFAKLAAPIEFRCKPYEDCLSEVVVTHSPRYLIDMNLKCGETIFDKIGVPYDTLRTDPNSIKNIITYYKSRLKPGEQLWWINQEEIKASRLVIRMWIHLTKHEKQSYRIKAMIYFPEIFSKSQDKFNRLAVWLMTVEGVMCPNIRDIFTAGGIEERVINSKTYSFPRIYCNLLNDLDLVVKLLKETSVDTLQLFWEEKVDDHKKVTHWTAKILNTASKPNQTALQQIICQHI